MSATDRNTTNVFTTFGWEDYVDLDGEALVQLEEATRGEIVDAEQSAGARLKAQRQKATLSLRALATRLGEDVHFTTLAKLETGRMRFTEAWAERIAAALNIHPAELLADDGTVGAARKIPVIDAEDIKFDGDDVIYPPNVGEIVAVRGSKRSFVLRIAFKLHRPDVPGYVQIDPDQIGVSVGGTYLLRHKDDVILASFEDNPARFVPWIGMDENLSDLLIGSAHFRVLGKALELTAKL